MADSILSITIRDTRHPCAPYQSTRHSFFIQIFHCDGKPLFWKGINYGKPFRLQVPGEKGGLIHAQIRVPPGCYLVRGFANCKNVVTEWAWVGVGCDETACVNLVLASVVHCINRMIRGLTLGTVSTDAGEAGVPNLAPDAAQAVEVLKKLTDMLPDDSGLPAPPVEDEIERTCN